MPETPAERFLTSSQVAAMFQVHPDTVRRWAEMGEIESICLPSGHRRFRESVIERALRPTGVPNDASAEPSAAAS